MKNKLISYIGELIFALFLVLILALSIRGILGNPSEVSLNNLSWKDDGPFELSPERGRFGLLYSIVENESYYFSVNLARFIVPDLGYKNGNYVSLFAPAVSFISIPGYMVGKYFGASQVGTFAVIALFALLNLILIKEIVESLGGNKIAGLISGMIFLFATPAYAYAVNLYQHHISTFLILFSILIVIRSKKIWPLFIVWFLCAMSIPVDYPNLFLMFPIGVFALLKIVSVGKNEKDIFKKRIIGFLTFTGLILPILFFGWFNQKSYGNALQFSGTVGSVRAIDSNGLPTSVKSTEEQLSQTVVNPDEQKRSAVRFFKTRNLSNGLYIHIFSPDRGLIYFAPIVFFGIFGLVILQKRNNRYLPMLLGVIFANIVLYSMWGDPWGGWAFGSRYLIPTYSIMAIFIGVALGKFKKKWLFLVVFFLVLSYSILVNTLGALTTSINPPKVEAQALELVSGKDEKYSIDRSWEFLTAGKSKSFVFQTWGRNYIDSVGYYYIVSGSIILLITSLLIYLSFKKETTT